MEPRKYRSKPVEVEAIQWDGTEETATTINEWIESRDAGFRYSLFPDHPSEVYNISHSDWNRVNVGDWIIKGTKGEFYPVDPETFALRYEPVDIPLISDDIPQDSPFREGASGQ